MAISWRRKCKRPKDAYLYDTKFEMPLILIIIIEVIIFVLSWWTIISKMV